MSKKPPLYRCEICRRNYGRLTGEIIPALWGSFCRRCVLVVKRKCERLLNGGKYGE